MEPLTFIVTIIILIMSVVLHELAHGYAAELLGDPTPRLQGRLTVNPLKHLEFFGSFVVPLITSMAGLAFGWAKPVQWNPYNVKNKRWGELIISIAGPLSNVLIAIVFGMTLRLFHEVLPTPFMQISYYIVTINIVLAVFNLIPIPPLDGSKVFFAFLPPHLSYVRTWMEQYSIFFFLFVVIFLWKFIEPIIPFVVKVILGT